MTAREIQQHHHHHHPQQATTSKELDFSGRRIDIPQDMDGMIFQAARAVEMAYRDGIARQTVRLALVAEGDSFQELNEWPGGAQQMFREAAKPLTMALLGEINPVKASSSSSSASPSMQQPWLRPKITCQDIWDFDGSALITAEGCEGPQTDVQALVFANTDVRYAFETLQPSMQQWVIVYSYWSIPFGGMSSPGVSTF
jgi:hypothetical protein